MEPQAPLTRCVLVNASNGGAEWIEEREEQRARRRRPGMAQNRDYALRLALEGVPLGAVTAQRARLASWLLEGSGRLADAIPREPVLLWLADTRAEPPENLETHAAASIALIWLALSICPEADPAPALAAIRRTLRGEALPRRQRWTAPQLVPVPPVILADGSTRPWPGIEIRWLAEIAAKPAGLDIEGLSGGMCLSWLLSSGDDDGDDATLETLPMGGEPWRSCLIPAMAADGRPVLVDARHASEMQASGLIVSFASGEVAEPTMHGVSGEDVATFRGWPGSELTTHLFRSATIGPRAWETNGRAQEPQTAEVNGTLQPGSFLLRAHPERASTLSDLWMLANHIGPETVDTLKALLHFCLERPRGSDGRITLDIDDILRLRGVEPQPGRTGFRSQDRAEVCRAIEVLQTVHVLGSVKRRENGVFYRLDGYILDIAIERESLDAQGWLFGQRFTRFRVRPGILWDAENLDLVCMLGKSLRAEFRLHPVKHKPERLLWNSALAPAFHMGAEHSIKRFARLLATAAGLILEGEQPERPWAVRTRLEDALGRLEDEGLIAAWSRETHGVNDAENLSAEQWLDSVVYRIEAPDGLKRLPDAEQLKRLPPAPKQSNSPKQAASNGRTRRARRGTPAAALPPGSLWARRRSLRVSQTQIAEELCVSQMQVSRWEMAAAAAGPDRAPSIAPTPGQVQRCEAFLDGIEREWLR